MCQRLQQPSESIGQKLHLTYLIDYDKGLSIRTEFSIEKSVECGYIN